MINDNELREGLKFIVGTWQPDFIVNLLSNDLAHIPAAEFKNNDGSDFTTLSFEFFEDNTMKLSYSGNNICESGTWEQPESYKYRYHIAQFEDIPTEDHKMIEWVTIPEGVTEEQIKAALDAGEIAAVKDGMFTGGEKEWKAVGGKYYYNTGEHRELFGEVQSPWDEIVIGEDGTIPLSGGMMKVRKI